MTLDTSKPVLLLGGKENSLSVVRHLGSLGIDVRVSGPSSCWGMYSRYCKERLPVPKGVLQAGHWTRLLLGADKTYDGHIVLALSDEAIEFLIDNREALLGRYVLDDVDPALQAAFLDKQKTIDLAKAAGIGTPDYWPVSSVTDIAELRGRIKFPVMVKPRLSHKFSKIFGRKLFIVQDSFTDLEDRLRQVLEHRLDVIVVEMIPGPDDLLSSYYTYAGGDGSPLLGYTKRVIRRWPVNRGNSCHHETAWLPETAAAGAKFFAAVGLRGLGNIEFKHDRRDGQLKIIEVNARMTAAQELVRRSGVPIDLLVYCHLTNQPLPSCTQVAEGLRMWYPLRDALSVLSLVRRGGMGPVRFLKSLPRGMPVFPLASLRDPWPMAGALGAIMGRMKIVWK